jgi:cell division protein FtsL
VSLQASRWAVICGLLAALVLALGILLVKVNNERLKLAYDLKRLATRVEQAEELRSKLEVERNRLISQQRLGRLAEEYGLKPAAPGQIRALGPERERGR